jgi:signal transduction histidine kinase
VETRLSRVDVLVPAGLLALGALELSQLRVDGWAAGILVEAVAAILLVWRRHATLLTCSAAGLVLMVMPWVGPAMDEPATPILFICLICYSLGRWIPDLRGLVGIAILLAMTLVDYVGVDARDHDITDVVFVAALSLPPWFFGRMMRRLAVQSEQLARQAELLRDEAVRAERDRIARELHDVIAHSLSAMVVQTAAAEDLVRTDPDRAAGLLATVAATGRSALTETGRLLHLIRDDADELGLRPAPGLGEVPRLVEEFRAGGLDVDAELDLPEGPVPAAVDVSSYRVVQEALTNALKYADGPVDLRIDSSAGELRISCANRAGAARTEGSGLGLQGMAERVAVLGGTIRHGLSDRAFSLDVAIPLGEAGT